MCLHIMGKTERFADEGENILLLLDDLSSAVLGIKVFLEFKNKGWSWGGALFSGLISFKSKGGVTSFPKFVAFLKVAPKMTLQILSKALDDILLFFHQCNYLYYLDFYHIWKWYSKG